MKVTDKLKFKTRITELIIIIATIVLTIISVNYANRGYSAVGGEYLIPVMGALIIYLIEERRGENGR